ncbi:MAG: ABC transporter ATP-binding protein [Peptostreptococcaceae bacterium]|nr:ABC transporter ATP-binding protein [Peptostreptococcaceae bacterium]
MGKLEIKDLNVRIGEKIYLDDISFDLPLGETLVIIGESGSGKTMLSKLLIGQRPEEASTISGQILFDDRDLLTMSHKMWSLYRGISIAYIAQNPMALFDPNQTIGSHARELFKSRLSLGRAQSRERMIQALSKFNLKDPEEIIDKYPFQLSGGMLQRIMFAMMMELSPVLIIADEPTSALDEHNTQTIIDTLKKCRGDGTSLIVITHDYELVRQLADRVIILKEGKIIERGDAQEILKAPSTEYGKALLTPRSYSRYRQV